MVSLLFLKRMVNWVAIFNTKNDAWGAYSYKESEDAVRVNVKPEFVEDNQESLAYKVGKSAINFAWAKARLSIPSFYKVKRFFLTILNLSLR